MNIVKQTKETITVELTPIELEVIRAGIVKESSHRRKTWRTSEPSLPEELMYHFIMHDTSEQLKKDIYDAISAYKRWGILK